MNDKTLQPLMIQHEDGTIIEGTIVYFNPDDKEYYMWTLEFTSPVTEDLAVTNSDLFECLVDLRRELAKHSYRPLCNGARLDVFPSGMCRDMGSGGVAYVIKLGKTADPDEDLVDIFEYSDPELITSVDEQYEFYKSWCNS
jgi:hypothetical protein